MKQRKSKAGQGEEATGDKPAGLSAKLAEDLSAHLTAGLMVELSRKPAIALAAVVYGLARDVVYGNGERGCLDLRAAVTYLGGHAEGIDEMAPLKDMGKQLSAWKKRLPKNEAKLWYWLLDQSQKTQLELLAFCAAATVDALHVHKAAPSPHAAALAKAVKLDMRKHWQPSADAYLGRVSKAQILEAVSEGCSPAVATQLDKGFSKKAALVEQAEKKLTGTGWLPSVLRPHETT